MKTNRKPNPKLKDKLIVFIAKLRKEIQENKVISDLEDSPAWKQIQKMVSRKADSADEQLNSFERLSDNEIRALLKERHVLKLFSTIVEDSERSLISLQNQLSKAEEELERYKQSPSGSLQL